MAGRCLVSSTAVCTVSRPAVHVHAMHTRLINTWSSSARRTALKECVVLGSTRWSVVPELCRGAPLVSMRIEPQQPSLRRGGASVRHITSDTKARARHLPRSDPETKFIDLGEEVHISYTDEGDPDAPVVVCLHGIPGSVRDFRYLGPQLLERGFRVIRIDSPGHGDTKFHVVKSQSPNDVAELLNEFTAALKLGKDNTPTVLMAHSFGGIVAREMAFIDPDLFSGMVLLASPGITRHEKIQPEWAMRAVAKAMGMPIIGPVTRFITHQVYIRIVGFPKKTTPSEVEVAQLRVALACWKRVKETTLSVPIPVLSVFAEDDKMIEPHRMHHAAEVMPDCTKVSFDDGGHHLHKYKAPEIGDAVAEWFQTKFTPLSPSKFEPNTAE